MKRENPNKKQLIEAFNEILAKDIYEVVI